MTFRQWLMHVRQWLYSVMDFPPPRDSAHSWVRIVGEREQTCLVCSATGEDRDTSDEELAVERQMNTETEAVFDKFLGRNRDV